MLEALAESVYGTLAWVRKRPFLAFLLTACVFSWSDWLSLAAGGEKIVAGRLPTDLAGMAGPAFAAFMVAAVGGREEALKDLARRSVRLPLRSPWFWLLAPSPAWVLLGILALVAASGRPVPPVAAFARYPGLPFLPLAAVFDVVLLAVGFGQEIGWRGLALPRLQARLGPLRGAIAVAVPWGIWLLPLLLVNRAWQVPGRPPVVVLLGSALLLVSSSIVLAFVVARSKGSLAAAAIWHACLRIATATEGGAGVVGDGMIAAVFVGAVLVVAAEHGARQVGRSLLAVPNPVRGAGARRHEPPAVRPT